MQKYQPITAILFSASIFIFTHFSQAQNRGDIYIDHLTISVNDLELAKNNFKELGFTIKPGRLHANSIENAHIKFEDGTALELITATEPGDELAKSYLKLMANGDGPAFLCLGMEDPGLTEELLFEFEPAVTNGGYYQWITFQKESTLSYLFFMKYANPPIDKVEHLKHENGVTGIKSIRLEKPDYSSELSMFQSLEVEVDPSKTIITLGNQSIMLEPKKNRIDSTPPVVSITLLVEDIHKTLEVLPKGIPFSVSRNNAATIPKDYCHGIQIVFEQKK